MEYLRGFQTVMFSAGLYQGKVDEIWGKGSHGALTLIEAKRRSDYAADPSAWSLDRRVIAGMQAGLNHLGFEAGGADGLVGHNTREAYAAFEYKAKTGKAEKVTRPGIKGRPSPKGLPRQADCAAFYGQPGTAKIEAKMVIARSPVPLRIDYDLSVTTQKMRVHELCAPSLEAAMAEVADHYGLARMQQLGIDRYAGGFNPRRMRGGSKWSMHAYGCAVDFYAQPNGLRMTCPQALFCGDKYKRFLDIMEAHNWLPAVRLWGKDAMHFQQARL